MSPNPQFPANLIIFSEEIRSGKFQQILSSVHHEKLATSFFVLTTAEELKVYGIYHVCKREIAFEIINCHCDALRRSRHLSAQS